MTQATDPAEVTRIFDADSRVDEDSEDAKARYNVAPTCVPAGWSLRLG